MIEYVKCQEYDPYNERSNSLGMHTFWRADYKGNTIGYGETKKECMQDAKKWLRENKD